LTIAYSPMELLSPDLLQIFSLKEISPFYKFHVHVKRYNMDDVPFSDDLT
jgi:hypothetical protein